MRSAPATPPADDALRVDTIPRPVPADDPRVARLAEEIAPHLRPHCAGMPAETFERLVRRAAHIRLRWPS
ncbi:hypothetical protein [Roseisolibacter sp. H3M3-2]|uniref:hypothetical protein n=1 Tax=Roseisolibacter sp. H3M3-2 TaxID=3031323 RepID=UPI0023DA662E|nr:hypothetical protein [Roseisolibacter sp. H3M3-2]MDF1504941.1 hypothetical protein [Roseisolibacter sp. H3M3-2]